MYENKKPQEIELGKNYLKKIVMASTHRYFFRLCN